MSKSKKDKQLDWNKQHPKLRWKQYSIEVPTPCIDLILCFANENNSQYISVI